MSRSCCSGTQLSNTCLQMCVRILLKMPKIYYQSRSPMPNDVENMNENVVRVLLRVSF